MEDQHIYHHTDGTEKVKVKLMKMSKSYQWEISVKGNETESATMLALIEKTDADLQAKYGTKEEV